MPVVEDRGTFGWVCAGADGQGDAFVVERYGGFCVPFGEGQQMPPPPQVVALAFDELAWGLPCLAKQFGLLRPYPAQFGDGVGPGHFQACFEGHCQRDVAFRWMHRQVDMLDGFACHGDADIA